MLHAIAARTTNSNTPKSDLVSRVWHTVSLSDGTTRQVLASDPITAINIANTFQKLFDL